MSTDSNGDQIAPDNSERERLEALERCSIMDTQPEHAFDRCVFTAAQLCRTPMAFISFIDGTRTWCKAAVGMTRLGFKRENTMCWMVVTGREEVLVEDIGKQARLASLPERCGESPARFYFGVPLLGPDRHIVGTLCVADIRPRTMSESQIRAMRYLADEVSELIRMRVPGLDLEATGS